MLARLLGRTSLALLTSTAVTVTGVGTAAAAPTPTPSAAPAAATSTSTATSTTTTAVPAAMPAPPADEPPVPAGFVAGRSFVLPDQTTPTRLVFGNPDGSTTMRVSTRPVRFRDSAGAWQEMDFTLVPGAAGRLVAKTARSTAASLSGVATGAFASLPTAAGPVTLTHLDVTAAAAGRALSGAAARFPGVLGGRDLKAQVSLDGVEESVVLPGRGLLAALGASAGGYSVALGLPAGVTARTGGPGVELLDAAGTVVATYGGGYARDSAVSRSGDGAEAPVTSTLVGQVGQVATVRVTVDAAWLADTARVFPVTIDPGLYANTSAESGGEYDTYTYSANPTTAEGSYDTDPVLKVGTFDGGGTKARTYLRFNTTGLSGAVTESHVDINNWYSYSCSGSPALTLSGLGGAFSRSGTTWNNQPGPDGAGPASATAFSFGYDSSCPGRFYGLPATSLAQRWANGAANNGVVLSTDEGNSYGWKKFTNGASGSQLAPALYITYDTNCTVYGGYSVCGAIRDKYNALGGPGGSLGNPVTNELAAAGTGRRSHFQNGSIYWRSDTGAHQLGGALFDRWKAQGYESGPLGYPTTDEYAATTSFNGSGDRQNDFENGSIYWNHNNNSTNNQTNPEFYTGTKGFFGYDTYKLTDRLTAKVNRGTGNLGLNLAELTAPGIAGDRTVGLNYASLATAPGSAYAGGTLTLGAGGWRATDSPHVRVVAGPGYVDYLDSSFAVWRFAGSGPTYTAPPGFDADLTKAADGTWTLKVHGSAQTLRFRGDGQLTSDADRNNNTTTFTPATGSPTTITGSRGAGDGRTIRIAYTGPGGTIGQLCQALAAASCTGTAPRSDTTLVVDHGYDSNGNLASVTDPNGQTTRFGYDSGSGYPGMRRNLITVTDPNGVVTRFTYDTLHRLTAISRDDSGGKGTTTYDFLAADGHTKVFDPEHPRGGGVFTDYAVDSRARITSATDAKGARTSTTWTSNNQVSKSTNALSGASDSSYMQPANAPAGQNGPEALSGTKGANGASSIATYTNPAGASAYAPTTSTDSMNNTSTYSYDGPGNLSSNQNALAATATVEHNVAPDPVSDGTVKATIDPNNKAVGLKTAYTYDGAHQLVKITTPGGDNTLAARTFSHDGFGRTATSGTGRLVTTFTYDRDGRVVNQAHNDNSPAVAATYDGNGNTLTSSDGTGTVTNTWTPGNQLAKAVRTGTGPSTGSYTYDKTGKPTSLTDSRGTTRYHYDKLGLLDQVNESGGAVDLLRYDANHSRTDTWLNTSGTNGTSATYDSTGNTLQPPAGFALHNVSKLDFGGRLIRIKSYRASSDTDPNKIADIAYCYSPYVPGQVCPYPVNPGDRVATDTSKRQWAFDSLDSARTTYRYDGAGRLSSAVRTGGASPSTNSYCYDADGNRTYDSTAPVDCSQVGPGKTTAPKYTYNSVNQITSGGAGFDVDGNQTAPAPLSGNSYNNLDQTVSLTPAGQGAIGSNFAGNGQDTRLTFGGTTFTNGIGGLLSQTSPTGGTSYFERDPSGGLLGTRTGTTEHWYFFDGLDSVLGLVDNTGTVQATYRYDPYGTTTPGGPNTALAISNPYRYAGGYQDTATGLYKYGKRYYQPALGRWTQQDTLDIIGDPAQGNRYAYAGDDPINNTDPTGQGIEATIIGGIVFAIAVGALTPAVGPAIAATIAGCLGGYASSVIDDDESNPDVGTAVSSCIVGAALGALAAVSPGVIGGLVSKITSKLE